MAFSPMIVLIDVTISHLFVFLLHLLSVSPFRCQLAHAHPLPECSIYRKGLDKFDLYLTSGLATSPDKNPKETKCETLVDSSSQQPFFSLFPSPLLARKHHLETRVTNSESSCTFCSFVACVNANKDSCLLRLE